MTKPSFLDKIAKVLIDNHYDTLHNTIIVLPNKRAKIFLVEALKKEIQDTVFAPEMISIEDFIQNISGLRAIDPIALVFEFYEVYLSVDRKSVV